MDNKYNLFWYLLAFCLIWWGISNHNEKLKDEGYKSGYSDGYDQASNDVFNRDKITREVIENEGWAYCGEWLKSLNK